MDKNTIKHLNEVFFQHPDWEKVLDLLRAYVKEFDTVDSINVKDQDATMIAAQVIAHQNLSKALNRFINETMSLAKVSQMKRSSYK